MFFICTQTHVFINDNNTNLSKNYKYPNVLRSLESKFLHEFQERITQFPSFYNYHKLYALLFLSLCTMNGNSNNYSD